jgi:hypothetical protein
MLDEKERKEQEEKEKLRRAIEARKYCKRNKIYLKIILIISLILI